MNRLRNTSSDSQASSRRRLIVERLEHRQLLSAADVFPTVDQIEMSVVLGGAESTTCELALGGGSLAFSGHYASQGAYQFDFNISGNQSMAETQPADLKSPVESALSSNMPAVRPEQSENTVSGRDFIDEDAPEGENPFDASAPPVVTDPVLGGNQGGSGGDFVPTPTIQQSILPFGIYLDTFQDADSASAELRASTNQSNGGFIDLTLLQRSESEWFDSHRGLEFETSARDGEFYEWFSTSDEADTDSADDTLLELGLVDLQELSGDSAVEELDLDVEVEVQVSQAMSIAEQVAFLEQFGGVIVHEDREISTQDHASDLSVAPDVPQERSRDQYQVVDAILGNAKAFDVMFDESTIETVDSLGSADLLEATLRRDDQEPSTDAAAVIRSDLDESSSTAAEASLTGSASVVLLLANRDKKKRQRRKMTPGSFDSDDGLTLLDA